MASTDSPFAVQRLERLTPAALEMLQELVAQSHWNQTAQDWEVFARLGRIFVVQDDEGRLVASGAVLPEGLSEEGGSVAWISMILVLPDHRGRGLGRRVFEHCLNEALAAGHVPMLDATPQGERLYRHFGFESLWPLTRWRRDAGAGMPVVPAGDTASIEILLELDAQALGFSRRGVLTAIAGRPDTTCIGGAQAVALLRSGRVAHHIGPMLAVDDDAGARLLQRLAACVSGPLLIDVPDARGNLARVLESEGFTRLRGFARMARPRPDVRVPTGHSALIHAVAGPEFA